MQKNYLFDAASSARKGLRTQDTWPSAQLPRLSEELAQGSDTPIAWQAQFEQKHDPVTGIDTPWLHLQIQAPLSMRCQRCLQALPAPANLDFSFRFVETEAQAIEQDAQGDEDVLSLEEDLDLRNLIEEELIMSLPMVAFHDDCLPLMDDHTARDSTTSTLAATAKENPFAVLAQLKKTP